jgi:hypothetical protein
MYTITKIIFFYCFSGKQYTGKKTRNPINLQLNDSVVISIKTKIVAHA